VTSYSAYLGAFVVGINKGMDEMQIGVSVRGVRSSYNLILTFSFIHAAHICQMPNFIPSAIPGSRNIMANKEDTVFFLGGVTV